MPNKAQLIQRLNREKQDIENNFKESLRLEVID